MSGKFPGLAALALLLSGCPQVAVTPCGPSTCAGCCDAMNVCRLGTEAAACGATGNACDVCVAGQVCGGGGTCTVDEVDGGAGGGAGGGGRAGAQAAVRAAPPGAGRAAVPVPGQRWCGRERGRRRFR